MSLPFDSVWCGPDPMWVVAHRDTNVPHCGTVTARCPPPWGVDRSTHGYHPTMREACADAGRLVTSVTGRGAHGSSASGAADGPADDADRERRPEGMREAMARYVRAVHQSYLSTGAGQPPAVRARMRLLTGELTVVAAAARNLHVVATEERLPPPRGEEVEVADEIGDQLSWRLRFLDPVVLPQLGMIDESTGPAFEQVRRVVGLTTHHYHLVVQPGSQLTDHHAGHAGAGLAMDHLAEARDFETIRAHARGREALVDELEGAVRAGLVRAQSLLAREIAPRDDEVARLTGAPTPPPATDLRKAVLAAVRGAA